MDRVGVIVEFQNCGIDELRSRKTHTAKFGNRRIRQFVNSKRKGEFMQQNEMIDQLAATADRLAGAAETLNRVLGKLDAQQESLNAKVDRIVAAVEENGAEPEAGSQSSRELEKRVAELEKANTELKAQASRLTRKTLSPFVSALLSKNNAEPGDKLESAALDKTMQSLSVEQRIAVKAEMARAGMIE
jgi:predicted RNase H-like nuclease (RuvC/YqgF family)